MAALMFAAYVEVVHCQKLRYVMNTSKAVLIRWVAVSMLMGLGACDSMSQRDKNTAIGAGVGAAGGAVLTGGSAAGTVGGAAVGGVIGHEIDRDKKHDD